MADSDLDAAVQDFARRFRAALDPPAQAGVTIARAELAARFDEPLPEHGVPLESILGELEARSADGLAGGTGGRYFGYVTGGSLPAAAIVEAWTAAVDQNPGMWPLGPAGVELEQVTIGWLADLLDYPAESGYFGSGATMANTVGLAVARHRFARSGWDRGACARSRSTTATRCGSTCSPRRSSAIAPMASSRPS